MKAITIKTQIGVDGILNLQLPQEVRGIECEVIVLYEKPPRKMSEEEWRTFIYETQGSLADNPIEEQKDNLPLEQRDDIE